ncbi:hypothetical protein [Lactimicrobium massiliense]|uniref:hypothetical protein n=1 Tax=Lactimicrobium massiliense TaxID=2161814 RepID=UPI003CCA4940
MEPQYLPVVGMTQLIKTIERVRSNLSLGLKYSGIVFTKVNIQTNIAKDTIGTVKEMFGSHIRIYI